MASVSHKVSMLEPFLLKPYPEKQYLEIWFINSFQWSKQGPPVLTCYRSWQKIMRFKFYSFIKYEAWPMYCSSTRSWAPRNGKACLELFLSISILPALCYPDFPTGFIQWRDRSARLMFGPKEGCLFLKASKRRLQNKCLWIHILTIFWWEWRALHFKSMSVKYCEIINEGFSYISCLLRKKIIYT